MSGPLRSGKPSSPLELLLRGAELTVEPVCWPVFAGHSRPVTNVYSRAAELGIGGSMLGLVKAFGG